MKVNKFKIGDLVIVRLSPQIHPDGKSVYAGLRRCISGKITDTMLIDGYDLYKIEYDKSYVWIPTAGLSLDIPRIRDEKIRKLLDGV